MILTTDRSQAKPHTNTNASECVNETIISSVYEQHAQVWNNGWVLFIPIPSPCRRYIRRICIHVAK